MFGRGRRARSPGQRRSPKFAVRGAAGRHTWVGGAAFERESFDPLEVAQFAYFYRVPGLFAQDDIRWTDWLTLSASARLDVHSTYGTFFSPRVSALMQHNGWTSRVSAGHGFYPSSPQTEETEAAGLSRLSSPAARSRNRQQLLRGRHADCPWSRSPATMFASSVENAVTGRTRIGLRDVQCRRPGHECRDGTARHVAPGAVCRSLEPIRMCARANRTATCALNLR